VALKKAWFSKPSIKSFLLYLLGTNAVFSKVVFQFNVFADLHSICILFAVGARKPCDGEHHVTIGKQLFKVFDHSG
jgi:hypothetical protein